MPRFLHPLLERPIHWATGLVVALTGLMAVLMQAPPGLPHTPSFLYFLPITLAALAGSARGAVVVTALAVVAHVGLEALHPASAGLTGSGRMRALALLLVGTLVCALGIVLRRTRARWKAALDAYREAAERHGRSEEQLRRLLAREHGAEQRERHRIARELHDDLQQRLTAISLELAALRQRPHLDEAERDEGLKRATTQTVDAIVATRRIVNGLRPRLLEESGLEEALRRLGEEFEARTGVVCEVHVEGGEEGALHAAAVEADCLYRVAQEALQNIEKHAGARSVRLHLDAGQPDRLELRVQDDGVGLPADAFSKPASLGLVGMTERTRELGGALEVRNGEAGGTLAQAHVARQPKGA